MRDIIKKELDRLKKRIDESLEISDDEMNDFIKNYSGTNKLINDFKKKVILNIPFTEKQKKAAKDFFTREKLSFTILPYLNPTNSLGKEVIKKGIETYLNLIKTDKKHLFKTRDDLSVRVGTPGPAWIKRNIDDLKSLKEKLSNDQLSKKIQLASGEQTTLGAKTEEIINTLEKDPNAYPGFIEKDGEWSIVNKIDTNYTNWFRILAELDLKNQLIGRTPKEKVENFFIQLPISEILQPEKINSLKIIEKELDIFIPTLSRADIEILREFNKDFLNIKRRILDSTEKGDRNEMNIKGTIQLFSDNAISEGDIVHFLSFGNRVDQVFGIDMLVYMYLPQHGDEKYWVPIQAKSDKSSADRSQLLNFNIGGIAVFPTKNPEINGNYGYITHKLGTEKSLFDLLEYNRCRKKHSIQSCKKFDK